MEDELLKLRPVPAQFKLGQLVAFKAPNQYFKGQPVVYFSVLSVELRAGEWFYGHTRSGPQTFQCYPEKKCRALTPTELDGTVVLDEPAPEGQLAIPPAMQATAPGIPVAAAQNSTDEFAPIGYDHSY
jgi:hypothetical protein